MDASSRKFKTDEGRGLVSAVDVPLDGRVVYVPVPAEVAERGRLEKWLIKSDWGCPAISFIIESSDNESGASSSRRFERRPTLDVERSSALVGVGSHLSVVKPG